MKRRIYIEGMVSPHCANRVSELLMSINEDITVEVNLEDGIAYLITDSDISDDLIRDVIANAGYKVTEII